MATDKTERLLQKILDELKSIRGTQEILQQDINAIRNGEYDKPQGANPARRTPAHTKVEHSGSW